MNKPEILDEAEDLPMVSDAVDVNQSLAIGLTRAEIDQQISTARAYPRSLRQVSSRILSMATLDEESAEECLYALPRGGKPIKGPSIRFAEILKQSYGNCRAAARVVHVDRQEKFVEAEGVFHDLETNSATSARVRRRIVDKRGRIFTDDMIIVTGNAACSIALRNAILGGVPKPVWRRAYEAVQSTIAGDVTTLSVNREKAVKAFAMYGVTPEQVFTALGVPGIEDVTVDHITVLRGMYAALKNGEATVEEMFSGTLRQHSDHAKVENPLSDDAPAVKVGAVDPDTGEITDHQNAPSSSSRDVSAGGEPSPEAGPQAEASPVGTDTGMPADREEHQREGEASPDEKAAASGGTASPDNCTGAEEPDLLGDRPQSALERTAATSAPADGAEPVGDKPPVANQQSSAPTSTSAAPAGDPAPTEELLRDYSAALHRASQADSLRSFLREWLESRDMAPPTKGSPLALALNGVFRVHQDRIKHGHSAGVVARNLDMAIKGALGQ